MRHKLTKNFKILPQGLKFHQIWSHCSHLPLLRKINNSFLESQFRFVVVRSEINWRNFSRKKSLEEKLLSS